MLQNISNLKGIQVLEKENSFRVITGGTAKDGREYFILRSSDDIDIVVKGKDGKDYF